ncbi:hypothetical protein FA13DRAFT_1731603 [Coprinellus micaceus]|uniref:Uncharacterized protein n=1 Tax=Coprinellus micaceus TaxID=71717 RepID=A0A4Y7TE00_COPMI|nr:hypothetical protein FA13DRAFT_1731603 [Coprinellus micaceus]
MGTTGISHIARRKALNERQSERETGGLKDQRWLQVFKCLDANKPCTQKQVRLRFSRKTLARRIEVREKIERRVNFVPDEETISSRGQISGRRPREGTKMLKPKEAVSRRETSKRAPRAHAPMDRSPGAPLAPERRSSRLSKPPEALPSPAFPRRRFVESDSESPSASSESSASGEEDEDSDADFAETDEDAPILHRARSTPPPKFNTRSSSQSPPSKNVANTSRTQIPFRPCADEDQSLQETLRPFSGAQATLCSGFHSTCYTPMILSPPISSSTGTGGSHSDEVDDCSTNTRANHPSFKPANHLEDCALAPRLKRKRKKLHDRQEAARLGDETSSEGHPGHEKRIRLIPTRTSPEPSPASSAFVPSTPWHPDPPSPLPMAILPIILGARMKLSESELEQRGCRLNLWDAWIP